MSARHALFLAFVLHRRAHGNTSLLLEILGAGQGRFAAIAKGARRPRQTASALLQPFQPLWLAMSGRGEVRTLTTIEEAGAAIPLQGAALLAGFYLNELLLRMLARHDPHDPLFVFYQSTLSRLAEDGDLESPLRCFERHVLAELGYGLMLDRVVDDGVPVLTEASYVYERERGPRYPSDLVYGPRISGATLLALADDQPLVGDQRREARTLLRYVLEPHLGTRPLQSRELYRRWFATDSIHEN
ncbi:DNA repair protein RecO [Allochromatium palmeri]|uniref:DNA repair protein RecO n=1 Tax=Allochromatium palmeri TaxID=231048 RepID=A0A6N8EDQ5_9GAMM|nr:DNA repair protein RecO [Allochromatium palmeri]MTW21741.1 DNA repair protein RecO [Allochromatium palmeri]